MCVSARRAAQGSSPAAAMPPTARTAATPPAASAGAAPGPARRPGRFGGCGASPAPRRSATRSRRPARRLGCEPRLACWRRGRRSVADGSTRWPRRGCSGVRFEPRDLPARPGRGTVRGASEPARARVATEAGRREARHEGAGRLRARVAASLAPTSGDGRRRPGSAALPVEYRLTLVVTNDGETTGYVAWIGVREARGEGGYDLSDTPRRRQRAEAAGAGHRRLRRRRDRPRPDGWLSGRSAWRPARS